MEYFNVKAILVEEKQWYYLTHKRRYKEIHPFHKGIIPKLDVIERLDLLLGRS